MIVTICQIHAGGRALARDWQAVVHGAKEARSDLVLLPELTFSTAFLRNEEFERERWDRTVDAGDRAEFRFSDLEPAVVVGTRPLDFGNNRYEAGFVWSTRNGFRSVHARTQPGSDAGARQGEWFDNAIPDFVPVPVGDAMLGFLIGSELWKKDEAIRYRRENVDLVVTPRLPSSTDSEAWLAAGRTAAMRAGAFCLSSAWADDKHLDACAGWALGPCGEVVAATDAAHPIRSVALDLDHARAAKALATN